MKKIMAIYQPESAQSVDDDEDETARVSAEADQPAEQFAWPSELRATGDEVDKDLQDESVQDTAGR